MLRALKLQKPPWPQALLASPSPYGFSPKLSGLRFRRAVRGTDINQPHWQSFDKMAQAPNQELEVGTDSLTSLGEAYAARCEDEGFGGVIYGKSMDDSKDEEDNDGNNQDSPAKFSAFSRTDPLTSLGEAYAARCEDEGFGGVIYGKSMNASKDEEDNDGNNQDSPGKFSGSEAKEERKDGNQDKEVTA